MAATLIQTSPTLRTAGSGATSTLSFSSNVTAGSKLVLLIGNFPSGIASITDNRGNTWQQGVSQGDGGDNFIEYWYADNAAAGATTLTITPTSTSDNYLSGRAQEWSGLASGAPHRTGVASQGSGVATSITVSTSSATTEANCLILTAAIAEQGAANFGWGGPASFTLIDRENDSNNNTGYQSAYREVTATGVQSATHTFGDFYPVDAIIAALPLATGGNTASPGAGSATITGQTPTVQRTDNRTASPGAGALTISGQAPTAVVSDQRTASPGAGALTLAGQQPTVAVSNDQFAQPGAGAAVITGQAPTLQQSDNRQAAPDAGALTLSGQAPTVARSENVFAQPGAGTLVLEGHAPTAQTSANRTAEPATGELLLTGHAPTVQRTDHHFVEPGAGALTISGEQPAVQTGDGRTAQPGAGSLLLSGHEPTIERTDDHFAQPPAGTLTLSGHAPTVVSSQSASPGAGEVAITGYAPTAIASANVLAEPGPGEIVITGYAPQIVAAVSAQPGAGAVTITGNAPTVRVRPIQPPKPAVNLLDPKYLGKKHRNVRFKPAKQEAPAPVVTAPTQTEPVEPTKPKGGRLLQALLRRIDQPAASSPPPAPAAPKSPPAKAPAAPPAAPAPAPYVSDLDPFYEPDPVDPVVELEARMLAQVKALQQQVEAMQAELQQLKKPVYVSDIDPFYEPEPVKEMGTALRERRRRENRRRAAIALRKLLD